MHTSPAIRKRSLLSLFSRQQALFQVLLTYSYYDPEVGYRKGLSHLAAMLLMWMGEEDAFWALVQLMEDKKYGLRDVYKPGSGTLEDLQKRLQHVIHQALPALEKHLEEQSICLGSITKHWFTQCFLEIVPFSLAIRLWDLFLLEGQQMLTTMAYTTLKVHQSKFSGTEEARALGVEEPGSLAEAQ
ncbi:USP6 N-terminal-like protein [Ochotona princeps]|uniref:USP6 N-terminal-like protein n=1 Tax=Ochotona princeps TaxID=9978 RepID=UPI002714532C|nr:USP6 N-terminal-like protein [Ochotona princeps]